MKYSIVGQKPMGLDPYLAGIPSGIPAVLVRDPKNPYDANAVMVIIDDMHVGYIPRNQNNAALAHHIDWKGRNFRHPLGIAADGSVVGFDERKAIDGTFVRSPNSAYPMVEIEDF